MTWLFPKSVKVYQLRSHVQGFAFPFTVAIPGGLLCPAPASHRGHPERDLSIYVIVRGRAIRGYLQRQDAIISSMCVLRLIRNWKVGKITSHSDSDNYDTISSMAPTYVPATPPTGSALHYPKNGIPPLLALIDEKGRLVTVIAIRMAAVQTRYIG